MYRQGQVDEQLAWKMEEHLLVCGKCLEIYLQTMQASLLTPNSSDHSADCRLSPDFTDKVMNLIAPDIRQQQRRTKDNLFLYYCAVAGIALLFWAGGLFNGLSGVFSGDIQIFQIAGGDRDHVVAERWEDKIIRPGWTERVFEQRPSLMEQLRKKKE